MVSAKRAREILEAAQVTPPTPADLEDKFFTWVSTNVPSSGPSQFDVLLWMAGLPDAKRRKLGQCSSRHEFLEQITESDPISSTDKLRPRAAEVIQAAADAFLTYPLDNSDILDDLWLKLENDYTKWTSPEHRFLAPYFAMVQSSGWGKSRLVSELHRKGLYVVYVSCMDPRSSGFPTRTPILADMICNWNSTLQSMAAFLIASMRVLGKERAQVGPEQWMKMQTDPKRGFPLSDKIAREAEQAKEEIEVAIRREKLQEAVADALRAAVVQLAAVDGFFGDADRSLKVLFCFDEATALVDATPTGLVVNCFTLLSRALGSISTGVWGVVLGTNSRLASFNPHTSDEAGNLGYELFKPFWQTGASVALQEQQASNEVQQAFRIGRPLWRALLDGKKYDPNQLLGFAIQKLNVKETSSFAYLTDEMVVGVLGCTIGLDVAAWSEVANLSMTYHMMTAAWISGDRRLVFVANAAEPVLAAAGATYLVDEEFQFHALTRLSTMCEEGIVMPGPELVSRFLLLLAILLCLGDKGSTLFLGRVTLREFLTKLLGEVPLGLNASIDLDGSELQLNSFSSTHREVTNELLEQCYDLHRGLTCMPCQEAVDCVLRSSNGDIGVQAKLWEKDNNSKMNTARVNKLEGVIKAKDTKGKKAGRRTNTTELSREQVEKLGQIQMDGSRRAAAKVEAGTGKGVKFMLGLVFQLGSEEERTWVEDRKRKTIVVHGFSEKLYPFLSPRVAGLLREILKLETSSYIHQMTGREQAVARRVLPIL